MEKIFLGWRNQPFPNYVTALTLAGAQVERDDPSRCDALLLPGGGDVHPRFYGQEPTHATDVDEARDRYEFALLRQFLDSGRPVLGICRGAQVINVALGGSLTQHIDGHGQAGGADTVHAVRSDDALLQSLYGRRFMVNSAHHQAVSRLGSGLRVIAAADDGTVEALRHTSLPILAVQWHPERFGASGARLLAAFLKMTQK